jgi:hypothetical protein
MILRLCCIVVLSGLVSSCSFIPRQVNTKPASVKKSIYQEVDLEGMIRRYIAKTHDPQRPSIEGIYTVTGIVTKKGLSLFNPSGKERLVTRRDNYARVAILKDWPGSNTEYVEISLSEKNAPRYPIVAELNQLAEGGGFIYKHLEPKGDVMTFTFLYDQSKTDILEGVYTVTKRNAEVTYKLSYVKVYPKANSLQGQ